jgi:hypothetical protein
VDASNSIVSNDAQGTIDTSSFCMMNCLPEQGQSPDLGSACRKISAHEQAQLLASGSYDPASIMAPVTTQPPVPLEDPDAPPEPPQLVDQEEAAAAEGGGAPAPAPASGDDAALAAAQKDADEKDKETGAMVAMASGKQALAAGIEARVAEAEAVSAKARAGAANSLTASKSNALLVMTAKAQVKAAEVRAAIYAKSAAKAAERVQAELKEIEAIPQKAAELAAAEAKKILCGESQEIANNVAFVKSRLAGPALPLPNAEAAVRAAQPYYNVMQTAIARGGLYEAAARKLQDEAQTLQEQSRTIASQAVQYQQAGNGDMAAKLMAQAKGMLTQAQAKDDQAQKDFAVAEGVQKQIPNYQANAAAASARATSIANPAGQPPPARAPEFLFQRSSQLHKVPIQPS